MQQLMNRPLDPYSPLWATYWQQNPNQHRGVGSDAVDPDADEGKGSDEDEGKTKPDVDVKKPDPTAGKDENKGPTDAEAKLLKESMKRKELIKDQKKKLDQLESELKKFEGIDLEQVRTLIEEQESAKTRKLEEKGEWEKLKEQMNAQTQTKLGEYDQKISTLESELANKDAVIEKLTIGHNFDGSGFIREQLTLTPSKARIVYGDHFDVAEGKVVAYDKPRGASDRTQLVDGEGEPLAFEAAIQKIVQNDPDRDHLIRSTKKAGSGSVPSHKSDVKPAQPNLKGAARIQAALNSKKAS